MGRLKKGCLIAVAVVVGMGVILLWVASYIGGQDTGYTEGYDTGHAEGYDGGYAKGYNEGQLEGYDKGQLEGYDKGQLEGYDEGHSAGYTVGRVTATSEGGFLVNPSYQEMKDFLEADATNAILLSKQLLSQEGYDCRDAVADINKNAEAQGIRAARVYVEFSKYSYTLVAFETIDRGLIFIDPRDDNEVKVEVGIRYYEGNGYGKQTWDDTIKEVVVTW